MFAFENLEQIGNKWTNYEGSFKNHNFSGLGTLILSNGEKFVGEFFNGIIHGSGTFYKKNEEVVIGNWKYGQLHEIF